MKQQTINITIAKTKQIIHSYIPLVFLFVLPHSFKTLFIAAGYIIIASYFYLKKMEDNESPIFYQYYLLNSLPTLVLLGGYVEGL
jgi:hypothetical protein